MCSCLASRESSIPYAIHPTGEQGESGAIHPGLHRTWRNCCNIGRRDLPLVPLLDDQHGKNSAGRRGNVSQYSNYRRMCCSVPLRDASNRRPLCPAPEVSSTCQNDEQFSRMS